MCIFITNEYRIRFVDDEDFGNDDDITEGFSTNTYFASTTAARNKTKTVNRQFGQFESSKRKFKQ